MIAMNQRDNASTPTAIPPNTLLDYTEVLAPASILDDRNDLAIEILMVIIDLLHEGMAVSADHKVDIPDERNEALVAVLAVSIVAEMAEEDNHVTLLLVLEIVCPAVHLVRGIKSRESVDCDAGYDLGDIRKDTDDADLHASPLDDGVWFYIFSELEWREIIVAAHEMRLDLLDSFCEILDAIVELMIAESHCIVLQRVRELNLEISLKNCVV